MKKYLVIIFISLLFFNSCKSDKSAKESKSESGVRQLNLNIGLRAADGTEITLERLKGKVLFINFWGSWVINTQTELNSIKLIADKIKNPEFKIVSISLDDPYKDEFKTFVSSLDLNYDIFVSPTSANNAEIIKSFPEIKDKIPCYYIIDKNASIIKYGKETGNIDEIIKIISDCLNEK
ncbi:MAG TPA: TlpA disulfide reductase family protein [bacterium]|nr:TlpA disulfide reductase family protein [bacterium]HPN31820.1 TlpA disulfide reductase family protein [bacterium]